MKLLLVNPNTSKEVTDIILSTARSVALSTTEIKSITASKGFPYISSIAEAQIAGAFILEDILNNCRDCDAVIIAAFGDPGLFAAKQILDVPVIGISEASILTACMLGRRFGIITFSRSLLDWYKDCIEMHGFGSRCVGIRALAAKFASLAEIQHDKNAALVSLANALVDEDGADVVIIAGAPLAGLAARVAKDVQVPLIDPVAAAIKQAEVLFALKPQKARSGTFARPPPKESVGLPVQLARRICWDD